jgi:hypothetical protein
MAMMAGCGGNIHCTFVSQNMNSIRVEPTDTRPAQLDANECYWWVDDDGNLNIAGRSEQKSLFGKQYDREFVIWLVPGKPSQGVGKDYRLIHGKVKGYIRSGPNFHRFESTFGLIGIENRPHDRLIASYRSGLQIQSAKLFGGWSSSVLFYLFGTLEAIPSGKGQPGEQIKEKILQNFDDE